MTAKPPESPARAARRTDRSRRLKFGDGSAGGMGRVETAVYDSGLAESSLVAGRGIVPSMLRMTRIISSLTVS
jgi:hypothetical protein